MNKLQPLYFDEAMLKKHDACAYSRKIFRRTFGRGAQVEITKENLPLTKGETRVGDVGWTWKFDSRVFVQSSTSKMSDYLASVRCRVALLRGEFSIVVPPETGNYMYELLDRNAPLVTIPQAYHHLLLDQPLPAFIGAPVE